jgi:hypothetical protein
MDVQALAPAASVFALIDPAQSQSATSSPSQPASPAAGAPSANPSGADASTATSSNPKLAAAGTDSSTTPLQHAAAKSKDGEASTPGAIGISAVHAAYKYLTNPVQVVVVFTDSNGNVIDQAPPQSLVQLVKFDHASGELVDRST